MACAICKGRHCLACEDAFAAKITGILARGAVEIALAERESKPHASTPSGDVGDGSASVRDPSTGMPIAQAPVVRSYDRALADSLEAAKEVLDELAEQHGPVGVGLLRVVEQRLAANRRRLGVRADVVGGREK